MADDWRTPDAEALFEAILQPRDPRRDRALLPRPVHAQRAARHGPALGGRPAARQRPALRRDLARDRRQHGDDHAHRLVAEPRRGRLPGDARQARAARVPARPRTRSGASDDATPPAGRPEQGPAGRADPAAAARRGPRLRGARPEPRRARPELRPRHPVRAHERRHRVRRRRRRRPRHHGHRPAERDRRRAAARPLARLRPLPAGGGRPERHARTRPSRTWPACASPRPTRTPPAASSTTRGIPVEIIPISGAVEVAPRLGLAEGIVDLVSTGSTLVDERPAPDRRRPRIRGGPRREPDRRSRAIGRPRRHRHDAERRHRGARPQVPDDERPGRAPQPSSRTSCRRSSRRRSSRSRTRG